MGCAFVFDYLFYCCIFILGETGLNSVKSKNAFIPWRKLVKYILTAILSLMISNFAHAEFQFTIDDLCTDKKIIDQRVDAKDISLGDFMVETLEKNNIAFEGSKYGISSINESPVGDDALIVLNDHEKFAIGRYYKIDGAISEKMPDQVILNENTMDVHWYYGFAHYFNGEWISQCDENQFMTRKIFCK